MLFDSRRAILQILIGQDTQRPVKKKVTTAAAVWALQSSFHRRAVQDNRHGGFIVCPSPVLEMCTELDTYTGKHLNFPSSFHWFYCWLSCSFIESLDPESHVADSLKSKSERLWEGAVGGGTVCWCVVVPFP